jgi:LPXTG-site transpeptidase (sortase) family protein
VNVNWLIVLGAFGCGLALALGMAAQQIRPGHPLVMFARLLAALLFLGVMAALVFNWPSVPQSLIEATGLSTLWPFTQTSAPTSTPPPPPTATIAPVASGNTLPTEMPQPAEPARLLIPAFNVDAPIVTIPIRNEQWDVSGLEAQVGWLSSTGERPGDKYAMVLVGHITLQNLQRGAFADLERAKAGTQIVYRYAGVEYVYEVKQRGRVPPNDVKALYVPEGSVLLLMTCTDWDGTSKTYANRLLVQAELVEQRPATDP